MDAPDLAAVIRQGFSDLKRFGAHAALVGGLAVSIRTRPRMTKDVDFSVAVRNDEEAEELIRAFLGAGYRHGAILEHELTGRLATVRLYLPGSQATEPDLDLLFATCGIEKEVVSAATVLPFPGTGPLPTARVGHLIAMKVLAESDARERDRADLQVLIAVADKRELQLAKKACQLIHKRGFTREKDLTTVLAGFVKRWRP